MRADCRNYAIETGQAPGSGVAPASALAYGQLAGVATLAGHMQLAPEMTFGFEPNCVLAGKLGSTGGTVITGGGGPIELNAPTARLLRA